MYKITLAFVAAGTALIAWGLFVLLFDSQIWEGIPLGEMRIAFALDTLGKPALLIVAGAGAMLGGIATATLARRGRG
ncbi:hypothetical protein DP939_31510 [Spongiactinospora rosea]|uniref:Uncharacterized protein n=1 Tax=Spongiactinospora rosea TaxID=2248750 RepID=A0A366LRB2_9ACTN|nr:hypothetical protein [Spongiactinospora rosea]RBQ16150.1 hypothetical protein DP939_31510 [Spongiactinospora rosea]